jgi:hypothetical protein
MNDRCVRIFTFQHSVRVHARTLGAGIPLAFCLLGDGAQERLDPRTGLRGEAESADQVLEHAGAQRAVEAGDGVAELGRGEDPAQGLGAWRDREVGGEEREERCGEFGVRGEHRSEGLRGEDVGQRQFCGWPS